MRSLITLLAVAMVMCLCGTALASTMEPPGTTAPSTSPQQDVRNPDNRVPPHPGQVPDTSASLRADIAPSGDTSRTVSSLSSDSGLSTFLIVLISVGGVVAIAGVAVATTRTIHHHPHGLT